MEEGFQTSAFAQSYSDKTSAGRTSETDLASGVVFSADFHKFDDLKNLLECNKDPLKLDAMRRIIGMVARGRDCSELFPSVVKNVVSKNPEIRKLVYVFLTRYAEEKQDIALLSVSTFQRSMKDSNQFIRASALRVLSSIRIPMLAPVTMLAIQDACRDLSPFVRKVAAHAIMKLYELDPLEKERLIELVQLLLCDKTTLVIGSAVQAFEKICPDRLDLIHPHCQKICSLLMDADEWGQVTIINMLTRYARTQFLDPDRVKTLANNESIETELNQGDETAPIASPRATDEEENTGYSMSEAVTVIKKDYDLLLDASRYLLQSRNTAVVMAVALQMFALKSKDDYPAVAKALIRCLHAGQEVQYIILCNIASLTVEHRALFEPYQRSFYAFASDSLEVKRIKLEILTNLATESTSPTILREFQHYVTNSDEEFVIAAVQAIGRCASSVRSIADICLNGLVRLLSRSTDHVMAECVIVLRKLLQMQNADNKETIIRIAELTDTMTVPSALASILWLLGEYSHRVPRIAPDVLRKMAKRFPDLEPIVKLQVLNLAAKLCIVNPRQTHLLAQYVFNLARYDINYDIRDRSRLLRALIFPQSLAEATASGDTSTDADNESGTKRANLGYLAKHARKIFLTAKPRPVLHSQSKDRSIFRLGSLSHLLSEPQLGYQDLPDWPTLPPNPWSRLAPTTITMPANDTATTNTTASSTSNEHSPAVHKSDKNWQSVRTGHGETRGVNELADFFSESDVESTTDDEEVEEEEEEEEDDDLCLVDAQPSAIPHETDADDDFLNDSSIHQTASDSSSDSSDLEFPPHLKHGLPSTKHASVPTTRQGGAGDRIDTTDSLTTQPSDSSGAEDTFSSAPLTKALRKQGKDTLSWMGESAESSSETQDTEGETDAEVNDVVEEFIATTTDQKSTHRNQKKDKSKSPLGKDADFCALPKLMEGMKIDWTTERRADSNELITGTSSATLPGLCDSSLSTDRLLASSYPPSPSVALDPQICPPPMISPTPTPLPTMDDTLALPDISCTSSLLEPIPSDSLRWYPLENPNNHQFHGAYQFTRARHAGGNPRFTMVRLRLCNAHSENEIAHIQLDFTRTAMGRLLLDANRVEPFEMIDSLPPDSQHECLLGIDFAGFTDPISFNLDYDVLNEAPKDEITTNGEVKDVWSFLIAPPPGELLHPVNLDELRFFLYRDNLVNTNSLDQFCVTWSSTNAAAANLSAFLAELLQREAHLSLCFNKSHRAISTPFECRLRSAPVIMATREETLLSSDLLSTYYYAAQINVNDDEQPCLIEVTVGEEPVANMNTTERTDASTRPTLSTDPNESAGRQGLITILCSNARFRSELNNQLKALLQEPSDETQKLS